jgi:hypothetical protein
MSEPALSDSIPVKKIASHDMLNINNINNLLRDENVASAKQATDSQMTLSQVARR